MGQFESHEKSAVALQVLFDIKEQQLNYTLAKLEEFSKQRYQNQVSKWDLMQFLQIDHEQVQMLTELLSSNPNNMNLSIHLMMVALVISQECQEKAGMIAKVRQLFELVSFTVSEGEIQKTEVRYIYHLIELWIAAVSNGGLPARTEPTEMILAQLDLIESQLYPDPEEDMASLDEVCAFIEQQPETKALIGTFQTVSLSESRKSIRTHISDMNQSKQQQQQMRTRKGSRQSSDRDMSNDVSYHDESQRPPSVQVNYNENAAVLSSNDISVKRMKKDNSNKLIEKSSESDIEEEKKIDMDSDQQSIAQLGSQSQVSRRQGGGMGDVNDLHWTTDVIQKVISAYSTKLNHYEHNSAILTAIQAKLSKYRQQTFKITSSDRLVNLKDLAEKIVTIQSSTIEFFGHRQLPYMMKSYVFEKQLVDTGFSINDYTTLQLQQIRATDEELKDVEDDRLFEDVMSRAYIAQAFREYYKHQLTLLKYELKVNNARMLHYLCSRGEQRILEKKKYKTLGELCSLAQIMELIESNKQDSQKNENSKANIDLKKKRSAMRVGAATQTIDTQGLMQAQNNTANATKFVPSDDQIFTLVYDEVEKLRSCQMSRRDLVSQMDTKQLRETMSRSISFWEGAMALLEESSAVRTFAMLNPFREFYAYAHNNKIKDEKLYKQTLMERQVHRQSFLSYNSQIGKIKGLALGLNKATETIRNEEKFTNQILLRTKQLMARLEKVDFALTQMTHNKIQRKRVSKQYFKALGKVSAYNTIVKSFPAEKIADYLILGMSKMRTQEIITIVAFQETYNIQRFNISVTESQLLTALQKMKTVSQIDKTFNLQPEQGSTRQQQFAAFQDELNQIAEMQRLMSEAPDHPVIDNLNKTEIKKDMFETVATMLSQYYSRSKMEMGPLNQFLEFAQKKLHTPNFHLTGELTYKQKDLENAGKVLFDFIDIEDRTHVKTDDLISWLGTLSSSLQQTYFNEQVEYLITHSQEAHMNCQKFATQLLGANETRFVQEIMNARVDSLNNFVTALKGANQGHLINNLDSQFMSLPLEYSLENNFWLVQAIKMQLNYYERNIRFTQLDQVHSPILLSKRSLTLNKKIAAQLILAAFDVGPQSVQGSDKSDAGDEEVWAKDKADFDKQFQMTKGEKYLELNTKRFLFSDVEEYLRIRKQQSEAQQTIRVKYIQEEGNGKYKAIGKDNLGILVRELNDEAFDVDTMGDLTTLLTKYNTTKSEIYDQMRQLATSGVVGGAKNFLEKIISLQTKDNSYGQNQTLLKLKDFVTQIHESVLGIRPPGGRSEPGSPNSQAAASGQQSRNFNDAQSISLSTVNSGEVSYHGSQAGTPSNTLQSQKTKTGKKGKAKKKAKKGSNPLNDAEADLITFVSKTKEIYQMVFNARKSPNSVDFFTNLKIQHEQTKRISDKLTFTQQYLKVNCDVQNSVPGEPKDSKAATPVDKVQAGIQNQLTELRINADRIGCRLIQDVQSNWFVNPVFVFNPAHVSQMGLPPLFMTKLNENAKETSDQASASRADDATSMVKASISLKIGSQSSERQAQEEEPGLASEMNSSQRTTRPPEGQVELSEHQKAVNFVLQFLDQISLMDGKIMVKMLLKGDSLSVFLQEQMLELNESKGQLEVYNSIHQLQNELINAFDLQVTPLEHYLKNYQRTAKFIQRDLLSAIQKSDEDYCRVFFDNVIARADASLIKHLGNRVDYYYSQIEMDEQDKLDFLTAQVKIKRELDQRLHTFKEQLDLEENKKLCQQHQSLMTHQATRINQEIATMQIIIRSYYLKQLIL